MFYIKLKYYKKGKVSDLNINEKKKVAIASALIFNPDIIVFEEPTMFLMNKDKEELVTAVRTGRIKYITILGALLAVFGTVAITFIIVQYRKIED